MYVTKKMYWQVTIKMSMYWHHVRHVRCLYHLRSGRPACTTMYKIDADVADQKAPCTKDLPSYVQAQDVQKGMQKDVPMYADGRLAAAAGADRPAVHICTPMYA